METVVRETPGTREVIAEFTRTNQPDVLLIINSKASDFHLSPTSWLAVPFVADLLALKKDMDTIYENSIDPRIEALEELEATALLTENRFSESEVGDVVPDLVPVVVTLGQYYKWGQLTTNTRLRGVSWLPEREATFKQFNKNGWWNQIVRPIVSFR
jgi:hypothetical protein